MSELGRNVVDWYTTKGECPIISFLNLRADDGKTVLHKLCDDADESETDQLALTLLLLEIHATTINYKLEEVAEILYNNDHIYMLGLLLASGLLGANSTYKLSDQDRVVTHEALVRLVIEKSYDKPLINLFCQVYLNKKGTALQALAEQNRIEGKLTLGLMKNAIMERMKNDEVTNV